MMPKHIITAAIINEIIPIDQVEFSVLTGQQKVFVQNFINMR